MANAGLTVLTRSLALAATAQRPHSARAIATTTPFVLMALRIAPARIATSRWSPARLRTMAAATPAMTAAPMAMARAISSWRIARVGIALVLLRAALATTMVSVSRRGRVARARIARQPSAVAVRGAEHRRRRGAAAPAASSAREVLAEAASLLLEAHHRALGGKQALPAWVGRHPKGRCFLHHRWMNRFTSPKRGRTSDQNSWDVNTELN